jgi:hypothetical protein
MLQKSNGNVLSVFDLWSLILFISFPFADDESISIVLHVPSPDEKQEQSLIRESCITETYVEEDSICC